MSRHEHNLLSAAAGGAACDDFSVISRWKRNKDLRIITKGGQAAPPGPPHCDKDSIIPLTTPGLHNRCCIGRLAADRGFLTRPRNGRGRTGLSDHSVLTRSRACTKKHLVHGSDGDKRRYVMATRPVEEVLESARSFSPLWFAATRQHAHAFSNHSMLVPPCDDRNCAALPWSESR
ncbi:hypothetical protein COCMIDRAFT_28856 [Bipolaris oryzae ATCC 44560]|uniref:Uncharacterized protein n=1 Tax=Bipolaris oryzae ATCC 44560 TaxID=930090 RepID=W6ZG89_COCMI|nr:uncharacterized protein COCMIDRAFT_28856 [Bipolaris oryzae ATCC 44560]EUC42521.1 hypothetical protein COCMIDRAFT_28856 [Bipolaris oryzae ATCC 44560]